jgi:quercetin dioxygenase-like cupin family protein
MDVVNIDKVPKKPLITPLFTGEEVTAQPLLADEGRGYAMSVVNFGKGVRNKFHAHDSDQILIVTAGRGYVATEKVKREVSVGDVIVFPAGEKHWHGATDESAFSHIYIRPKSGQTTQLED